MPITRSLSDRVPENLAVAIRLADTIACILCAREPKMGKYTLESKPFPALPNSHQGSGTFSGSTVVVDPDSVTQDVNSPLKFKPGTSYKITVLSVEIATNEAPNWFGVSFRDGIKSFDTVNIFCHPSPGGAGMQDKDYATRTGEWPKLFRYAEIFGRQMYIAQSNHITIVPFFTNATYASTGIFGPNWKDIVEQILVLALAGARAAASASQAPNVQAADSAIYFSAKRKKGGPAPAVVDMSGRLKHVVLSDFSYGRTLMWSVRSHSPGMDRFLREVWDFDGVQASVPVAPRGIIYDQGSGFAGPTTFHVPATRWLAWHHAVLMHDQLHGDLPAMLACHAATISRVG